MDTKPAAEMTTHCVHKGPADLSFPREGEGADTFLSYGHSQIPAADLTYHFPPGPSPGLMLLLPGTQSPFLSAEPGPSQPWPNLGAPRVYHRGTGSRDGGLLSGGGTLAMAPGMQRSRVLVSWERTGSQSTVHAHPAHRAATHAPAARPKCSETLSFSKPRVLMSGRCHQGRGFG